MKYPALFVILKKAQFEIVKLQNCSWRFMN